MEMHSGASEEESDDAEVQEDDWRFSELATTDLATLREVDPCVPFRFPSIGCAHWRKFTSFPTRRPPFRGKPEWYDAIAAHWASDKGLAAATNKNKGAFNAPWAKLCYNHKAGDPDPDMLVAVRKFPLTMDERTVTCQEVSSAIKSMWHAAKTKLAELGTTKVPAGTPPWGGHDTTSPLGEVASDTSPRPNNASAFSAARTSQLNAECGTIDVWQSWVLFHLDAMAVAWAISPTADL